MPQKGRKRKKVKRLGDLQEMLLAERTKLLRQNSHPLLSEGNTAHGDMADMTTEIAEREQKLRLAEHERERLQQLEEALAMVAEGKYGICSTCGEPIPDLRLKAVPTASHCINCQSQLERRG